MQWDFKRKELLPVQPDFSFLLKVSLGYLHPSIIYLAPVKTWYPLTSITGPYPGLSLELIKVTCFLKLTADPVLVLDWIVNLCWLTCFKQGWVVRKLVNANPRL